MWEPIWPELTARHDVIRYDLRGFGDSDTPPHGLLDHGADLLALLDRLGVQRCHLVGASLGSGVAVEVALQQPGLVASLLLGPPGGGLLATMTPALRSFADRESAAWEAGDLDEAVAANLDTWVVGVGRGPADVDAGVLDAVRVMQRRVFDIAGQWGSVDWAEPDPPVADRLSELRVPVCTLVGGHDLDTVQDAADRISAAVATTRRLSWPDVAHLPSLEQPGRFLDTVQDWLAGLN